MNLIVGTNSSGKTKILNTVSNLARLLAGDIKSTMLSANYDVEFFDNGQVFKYQLEISNKKVTKEVFSIDSKNYLDRGVNGVGKIWAEKLRERIEFQLAEDDVAAYSRRDSIQHPFFEKLYEWARSLYHYRFSTNMGKEFFAVIQDKPVSDFDPRQTEKVVGILKRGIDKYGDQFIESIKADMAEIGYFLDDVNIKPPVSVVFHEPAGIVGLSVKESNLSHITDQADMSDGMFRAISLIIQLNFAEMTQTPSCVLIDDIGEGLDFERSCSLIKLLLRKTERSKIQLIMATNDRFIMNSVPLEAWTVLRRTGSQIKVYNYSNSRETFDQFKFTGLNNFDFFAYNFADSVRTEE